MLLLTIADILSLLIRVVSTLVIVQFILGLFIAFNVVNMSNQFVAAIWTGLNALLQPLLAPIRRMMPNTGSIDFSPMVLIIGLQILQIIVVRLMGAA